MNEVIFTFDSVTYANKAKKILSRAGVQSKLIKLSDSNESGGCIHGLSVSKEGYYTAVKALREIGVSYRVRSTGNGLS
ncbi:MAG: DUF3343 domain-containing protein [Clostridia bacterium]|nr:DUF3343 domain-containing protein [Clostridia bacterium]